MPSNEEAPATSPPSTPCRRRRRRAVVFPVADSDCCSSALRWALDNVARPDSDVFHLAYVVPQICCRLQKNRPSPHSPSPSPPSSPHRANPFCAADRPELAAQAELHAARAMMRRRFSPLLEAAGVDFEEHLIEPALESGNGNNNRSEEVGEALVRFAASLGASLVVVGGGLKGSGGGCGGGASGKRGGGGGAPSCGCSVTKYCLDRCPATVCVVRGVGGGR